MEIEVKPLENSVEPALIFTIKDHYQKWKEILIKMDGWLLDRDGKAITQLHEFKDPSAKVVKGELAASGTKIADDEFSKQITYETQMAALLNKKALEYIENLRGKNPKRDVILKLRIKKSFLSTKALIPRFQPV